jgi:hypothetical protein
MIGLIVAVFLQVADAPAAPPSEAPTEQVTVVGHGTMPCNYDRGTRVYTCMSAENEQLLCRRERMHGSRFRTMVCLTPAEARRLQEESQTAISNQQRISIPSN